MPKFIYTVALATTLLWFILFKYAQTYAPDTNIIILGALVLFFAAATLTISLGSFIIKTKRSNKQLIRPRKTYRKTLKKSAFYGLVLSVLLAIKAFMLQ